MARSLALGLLAWLIWAPPAAAESVCDPDGVQTSGSIYRICMPASGYNGILVVWAHGFQHTGTPVSIPEDQLCLGDFCLHHIVNDLGFAFATNSYSKTGLAIRQGQADIIDLVHIFETQKGVPGKVYLIGASEGGIITALNLEQRPDLFSAGIAACGPVGSFASQLNYLGDGRATFEYFFPGLIPGDPFHPDDGLAQVWTDFYEQHVKPVVFDPANRSRLDQWVKVARLPFDAANYLVTVEQSVSDVLKYSVVNVNDAAATLGGFPFDNRFRWYGGSGNDLLLNIFVPRKGADPAAVKEMQSHYDTTGVLVRPLITLHTLRDQQVPYFHEGLYDRKTMRSGSWLSRHINIPVNRYGHCNFTQGEALFSFAVMLFYDGLLDVLSGTASYLPPQELSAFESRAQSVGLPVRRSGAKLAISLKPSPSGGM